METTPQVGFQLGGIALTPNHLNIQPKANDCTEKITDIMKEQFGLKLKEETVVLCNTSIGW
jgi:hypothetical protein